jgi:hypothetical protein
VIVYEFGVPGQPAAGVTVIVAVIDVVPVFTALKPAIFPEPLAGIPIEVLEFVQVKVAPVTGLVKFVAGTALPLQKVAFAGTTTVGTGLIVIV